MVTMAGIMPGPQELIIILIIILLLFGGSRLAGLGKSTGRAIKEFKEETKGLKGSDPAAGDQPLDPNGQAAAPNPVVPQQVVPQQVVPQQVVPQQVAPQQEVDQRGYPPVSDTDVRRDA